MSVVMSLLQPALAFLTQSTRGYTPTLSDLIGRGQLLTITMGLSICAAGALFMSDAPRIRKIEAGLPTIIVLLITTYYCADVAAALRGGIHIDSSIVAITSLVLHCFAVIVGTRCTFLSEER